MAASEALRRYQQYLQAQERERLAWETCERLKQTQPLDLGALWDAQRAYECAQREQSQAWATYEEARRANVREAAALGAWDPLAVPPEIAGITSTDVVLIYGRCSFISHPQLGAIGEVMVDTPPGQRPMLHASIAGLQSDREWVKRLALLREIARKSQKEWSQRFKVQVAPPLELTQAKRQVRLCQRLLQATTSAEVERQVQKVAVRERTLLREALCRGLLEVLADQIGLDFDQVAERKRVMWGALERR